MAKLKQEAVAYVKHNEELAITHADLVERVGKLTKVATDNGSSIIKEARNEAEKIRAEALKAAGNEIARATAEVTTMVAAAKGKATEFKNKEDAARAALADIEAKIARHKAEMATFIGK